MIRIGIADLAVEINNKYEYIKTLSEDYLTDELPDFCVEASEEDFELEAKMADFQYPREYLESIIVYRKIAERLPDYGAFVFHGVAVEADGGAYIFTAPSGVGKTTHVRLWLREFSDVGIINGDKPIVRFVGDQARVYGTPWRGKEGYGVNKNAHLLAVCFVGRSPKNSTAPLSVDEASVRFFRQVYMPEGRAALAKTLALAGEVLKKVGRVRLDCNMLPEAAHISREALKNVIK